MESARLVPVSTDVLYDEPEDAERDLLNSELARESDERGLGESFLV